MTKMAANVKKKKKEKKKQKNFCLVTVLLDSQVSDRCTWGYLLSYIIVIIHFSETFRTTLAISTPK